MSRFDQDREELIRLIFSICDYARLGYSISTYNSCNNCKANGCEYKPKWGEHIRYNCPLHLAEADRKTEATVSKMEQVDEPKTEREGE